MDKGTTTRVSGVSVQLRDYGRKPVMVSSIAVRLPVPPGSVS